MGNPNIRKLRSALAIALLAPALAVAAGLGKLTVNSGLGQPLNAEIEIVSVQPNERDSLQAKVASPEAFRQANIDYASVLTTVRTAVERRPNGRYVIKLTSSQPVNDPFVDLLVELSWATGRLVREYTFLLDPVEYAGPKPITAVPPVAAPVAPSAPAVAEPKPAPAPRAPESRAVAEKAPTPSAVPAAPGGTYEVKQGDTLAKIAQANLPAGVTLQQMLVALQRANEDAFINKNLNLLKAGKVLTIPDRAAAEAVAPAEASRIVAAQTADWNDYRSKVAGAVAAAPAAPEKPEAAPRAAGKITPKVEDKPASADAK